MALGPRPAAIDDEVRGILLAVHLLGADDGAFALLAEAHRAACTRTWKAIGAPGTESRAEVCAGWQIEAASVLPAGLAHLHPSWIEGALAGERPAVAEALESAPGAAHALPASVLRPLARLAFSHLLPLVEGACGPLAERLCGLSYEALLEEVTRLGARTLGRSLAGASPDLCARAMASVGEPWAQEIAAGAREILSRAERRAAVALASGPMASPGRTPLEQLRGIGVAALAVDLAPEAPGSRGRVAGRLPAALGRSLAGW